LQADDFARAQNASGCVIWAQVNAAGALSDAKRLGPARVYLDAAGKLDPRDKGLRLHRAELLEAQGRFGKALAGYEALLKEQPDPDIDRRAFVVARKSRQGSKARLHFEATQKSCQHVIDGGEIYTLGTLARLYCDAEVHLDQALALAQRNLEYKRDIDAQATLACVQNKLQKLKADR